MPVVVGEAGRSTHRTANRCCDRLGGETQHEHVLRESGTHRSRDRFRVHGLGKPIHGRIDVGECRIRLQEEVAREMEVDDFPIDNLEIGDHQFAARDLELTVHDAPPLFGARGRQGHSRRGMPGRRASRAGAIRSPPERWRSPARHRRRCQRRRCFRAPHPRGCGPRCRRCECRMRRSDARGRSHHHAR